MLYSITKGNMELAAHKCFWNSIIGMLFILIAIVGFIIGEQGLMIVAMSISMAFCTLVINNFVFWSICNKKLNKERG